MSEYVALAKTDIDTLGQISLRVELRKAQTEIERLRDIHSGKAWAELWATDIPLKDLSDLYPLDGPNVRNQNAHDVLSKRLEKLEGAGPKERYQRHSHTDLTGRLDDIETDLDIDEDRDWASETIHERLVEVERGSISNDALDLLETRLTALSETVARNKKSTSRMVDINADSHTAFRQRLNRMEHNTGAKDERRVEQRRTKAAEPPKNQLRRFGAKDRRQP